MTGTVEQRSAAVGYSYNGGICSRKTKYSIAEEIGGFYSISAITNQLGRK